MIVIAAWDLGQNSAGVSGGRATILYIYIYIYIHIHIYIHIYIYIYIYIYLYCICIKYTWRFEDWASKFSCKIRFFVLYNRHEDCLDKALGTNIILLSSNSFVEIKSYILMNAWKFYVYLNDSFAKTFSL